MARARPGNEDLAIVMVSNILPGLFPFAELRSRILELPVDDYGLVVKEIQKCPFGPGQAFVRMNRASDRDSLVHHGPHHLQGLTFVL